MWPGAGITVTLTKVINDLIGAQFHDHDNHKLTWNVMVSILSFFLTAKWRQDLSSQDISSSYKNTYHHQKVWLSENSSPRVTRSAGDTGHRISATTCNVLLGTSIIIQSQSLRRWFTTLTH